MFHLSFRFVVGQSANMQQSVDCFGWGHSAATWCPTAMYTGTAGAGGLGCRNVWCGNIEDTWLVTKIPEILNLSEVYPRSSALNEQNWGLQVYTHREGPGMYEYNPCLYDDMHLYACKYVWKQPLTISLPLISSSQKDTRNTIQDVSSCICLRFLKFTWQFGGVPTKSMFFFLYFCGGLGDLWPRPLQQLSNGNFARRCWSCAKDWLVFWSHDNTLDVELPCIYQIEETCFLLSCCMSWSPTIYVTTAQKPPGGIDFPEPRSPSFNREMCLAYSSRVFECFDLNDGCEKDMLRYLSYTLDFRFGTGEMEQRHVKQTMCLFHWIESWSDLCYFSMHFNGDVSISGVSLSHEKAELEQKLQQKLVTHEQVPEPDVKWSHGSEVDCWNSSCGAIPYRLMSFDCWPVGVSVWACVVTRWASRLSSHSWQSRQGQWRIGQPFQLQVSPQMVNSAGPPGSLPPWRFVYLANLPYPNHYSHFVDRQNCKWRKMPWRHFRRQISGKVGERCAIYGWCLERSDEQSWWYLRSIFPFMGSLGVTMSYYST